VKSTLNAGDKMTKHCCKTCGKQFDDWIAAQFCEDKHKLQTVIDKLKTELEQEAQADIEINELVKTLTEDNDHLRELLRQIEEHPHCIPYYYGEHIKFKNGEIDQSYLQGTIDGHLCAAQIIKKAKEQNKGKI
jgi:hypothetical protein